MESSSMKTALKVSVVLLVGVVLISSAAMAQGADFNQSMGTVLTQYAYGLGAKAAITMICGYLFAWGLGHQHLWVSFCAIIGAIGYWGMGVFLGAVGIA
jgi:hypothetical protein